MQPAPRATAPDEALATFCAPGSVRPLPASVERIADVRPTPLDICAAWLRGELPWFSVHEARRAVMCAAERQRMGQTAGPIEQRIQAAWTQVSREWMAARHTEGD